MSFTLPSAPTRLVIASEAHARWVPQLAARRPDLELRGSRMVDITPELLDWAQAYVGFKRPLTATMGNVRWVHCTGAGVDGWMAPGALPTDILLTRTTESFGPPIAEWALSRALVFTQRFRELEQAQREQRWARDAEPAMLAGQSVLVVGTGDVGTHVARAFAGLGCRVVGISRTGQPRAEHGTPSVFAELAPFTQLGDAMSKARVVVLTAPLTPDTRGLVNRDILARAQQVVLLNAGRGALLDESAIIPALDAGNLSACALDVFETEPLPPDSPLWHDDRVMISPHVSGPSTAHGTIDGLVETLEALERGERPRTTVDRTRGY